MSVSRETVAETVRRFDVPEPVAAADHLYLLLEALAAEPDPPTTVREPAHALEVHVADSLAGLQVDSVRNAERIADLGAGAGFPGLALAAALPGVRVDLVESARRKCEVIGRLADAAGLESRARPVPARAEEWAAGGGKDAYDVVTARALAPLAVLCEYAAPLLRLGGVLVAWKGARQPDEEGASARAAAQLGLTDAQVVPVTPYVGSRSRHLHVYSKVSPTPERYPRRAGMAVKKPLG
ncbi:MAG: rRNA (guanine527-N7)-methyltransferase [Thermoleophilaceae bacterium]|nr:rRNA (guanine527-N7)-methyltransferase [Thermoleophilaceae bacterium]